MHANLIPRNIFSLMANSRKDLVQLQRVSSRRGKAISNIERRKRQAARCKILETRLLVKRRLLVVAKSKRDCPETFWHLSLHESRAHCMALGLRYWSRLVSRKLSSPQFIRVYEEIIGRTFVINGVTHTQAMWSLGTIRPFIQHICGIEELPQIRRSTPAS